MKSDIRDSMDCTESGFFTLVLFCMKKNIYVHMSTLVGQKLGIFRRQVFMFLCVLCEEDVKMCCLVPVIHCVSVYSHSVCPVCPELCVYLVVLLLCNTICKVGLSPV